MIIFRSISEIPKDPKTVLTVGTFDGLHVGHRKIIQTVKQKSKGTGCRSVALTFDPHPRLLLQPASGMRILSTVAEKAAIFEEEGIDFLIVQRFDYEFSQLTSREFVTEQVLEKIGLSEMVVGHDHRFGKGRDGDENTLRELSRQYSFGFNRLDAVRVDDVTVSSTKIRNLLLQGKVTQAAKLLGYQYSIAGTVVEGNRRGRTIGFPTANIQVESPHKLVPANGVYAVNVLVSGQQLDGVMNIGTRPTFDQGSEVFCEVFILRFADDIYGSEISVKFVERIRDEKKFASLEELIVQIKSDAAYAAHILT